MPIRRRLLVKSNPVVCEGRSKQDCNFSGSCCRGMRPQKWGEYAGANSKLTRMTCSGGFPKPYSLGFSRRSRCSLRWWPVTSSILWVVSEIRCLEKLDNMKEYWNISWIRPLHYSCVINSQNIKGTFLNIGPYSVKEIQNSLLRLNRGAKCRSTA